MALLQRPRRRELVAARPHPGARTLLGVVLALAVAVSLFGLDLDSSTMHSGGLRALGMMAASLLRPDLSPGFLLVVAEATVLTVAYAVAGTSVALAIGLPGALLVSGALTRRRLTRSVSVATSRGGFAVLRGVHELVWALLLLSILGLTPLAGILAIGIPYGAMIARVLGERLQDVPDAPLVALRSAGASPVQVLCYGRVPIALADLVGYGLYRFECAIRAAAVLSFIGLGGIGYRISLALDDLRFAQVWTLLAALVLVIVVVDWVSGRLRERVRA